MTTPLDMLDMQRILAELEQQADLAPELQGNLKEVIHDFKKILVAAGKVNRRLQSTMNENQRGPLVNDRNNALIVISISLHLLCQEPTLRRVFKARPQFDALIST